MVKIEGSYKLVKNENLVPHMIGLGVDEERANKMNEENPTYDITVDGKKITIKNRNHTDRDPPTYILNEEITETYPPNVTFQSTATLDGNKLTISSKTESGRVNYRIYTFSDSELVQDLTTDDPKIPKAKRYFKRV